MYRLPKLEQALAGHIKRTLPLFSENNHILEIIFKFMYEGEEEEVFIKLICYCKNNKIIFGYTEESRLAALPDRLNYINEVEITLTDTLLSYTYWEGNLQFYNWYFPSPKKWEIVKISTPKIEGFSNKNQEITYDVVPEELFVYN